MKRCTLLLLAAVLLAGACSPGKSLPGRSGRKIQREIERSAVFSQSFTGFSLCDVQTGQTLAAVNDRRYFTPASNTKILTLATCLQVLGDSIPRFRYGIGGADSSSPLGTCVISGTGDPTLLHPDFAAWQDNQRFIRQSSHPHAEVYALHMPGAERLLPYGPGWMWDDLADNYSAEISDFPVYGNLVKVIYSEGSWHTQPPGLEILLDFQSEDGMTSGRDKRGPVIRVPENPGSDVSFSVPVFQERAMLEQLTIDTLHWYYIQDGLDEQYAYAPEQRWYACPSDTAYRRMMYQSDNFFAEQLLLLCSGEKFDTLDQNRLIAWMRDSIWNPIPDLPRWVDGSGLSRYNLATPAFLTGVLHQLWQSQSHERLFDLFPAGGIDGTLHGWYGNPNGQPYIFAKSGSMSGVYCLSGYLVAKSGRVLAFSFMCNNFVGSNRPFRLEIQRFLQEWQERL